MARIAFGCTLGQSLGEGRFNSTSGSVPPASTSAGVAAGTLTDDVAAAVAVLVADGACPTQAHVNTLNTAWGLLATAIAAANTGAAAANMVLDIDTSVITTRNALRAGLRDLLRTVDGSGMAA